MHLALALLLGTAHAGPQDLGTVDDGFDQTEILDIDRAEAEVLAQAIVNGEETTAFKNVVALGIEQGGFLEAFCSGTLIHPLWVVTAAHCVDSGATSQFAFGNPVVVLGSDVGGGADNVVPMEEWLPHPAFDINDLEGGDDIGLVRLATPVNNVRVAVLNDEVPTDDWIGRDLTFVGFGITGDNLNDSGVKRTTTIPIRSVTDTFIESFAADTNVCNGDSGGAAFEDTPDGWELAGINSYVTPSCNGGANGVTNVANYIDWILESVPSVYTAPIPEGGGDGSHSPVVPGAPGAIDGLGPRWASVSGEGVGAGCNSAPTGAIPAGWLLLVGFLGFRRR